MSNWDPNNQWYNWNTAENTGGSTGFDIPDDHGAGGADFSSFYGRGNNANTNSNQQNPSSFFQSSQSKHTSTTSSSPYGGNVFYPDLNPPSGVGGNLGGGGGGGGGGIGGDGDNFDSIANEPPLLEELGVNFDHIRQKTLAVLNPLKQADPSVIHDNDLAGPLVFCLLFGAALLFHGKVHFGFIYGIGVLGCLGIYLLLNLMSTDGISLTCTVSVIGYCLLPMGLLSLMTAVLSFKGIVGLCISIAAVFWCSLSASKLFVIALSMDSQRWLVAYPCSLLYGVFALLAIF